MKKIVALLLAAMMVVAAFASCGGGNTKSSTESKTDSKASADTSFENAGKGYDANVADADFGDEKNAKLKVWGPDAYTKLLKQQCDDFTKLYADKNIKIEVVVQSEDSAATQMQTDAKTGADVFGFASDQLNNLLNAGILYQIAPKYAADVEATNNKAAVDISKSKNSSGAEGLYAFPETGNGYFLVYDKSVVSDEAAASLEGILDACKKEGKKFIMDVGNGYYACMFVFTGGLRLDGLGEGNTQLFNDYDEKEVVASMKAFSKLMHDYKGTFQSDAVTAIPSGFTSTATRAAKVGAGIDGNWDTAGISKALGENFGAAKLPTINIDGKDTQIYSMYGYKMIGVNANSKFPRTAQILAYYLSSEKCQQERADQLGWSPTNNAVVESDTVKNDVAISALLAQSEFSIPQANVGAIWDPLKNLGNKLLADDTDPEKFDFNTLLKNTIANING